MSRASRKATRTGDLARRSTPGFLLFGGFFTEAIKQSLSGTLGRSDGIRAIVL